MKSPFFESLKEVWRWAWSYILTGLFYALLGLIQNALPFFPTHILPAKIMLLGFSIPIQMITQNFLIPAIIRALDKYKYVKSKENIREETKGLPGFNLLNGL